MPLLPGPLWHWVVVPVWVTSIGQIEPVDWKTWYHITVCKLFVLRIITWIYNCFLRIILTFAFLILSITSWRWRLLGRFNVQRGLNPFLFQAELPLPFSPLLFWVLMWTHETGTRSCVERETKDDFKFLENK